MAASTGTTEPLVIIKKYSNRRLYDTRQSRYITLEDLAGIIQGGATVKVVDASSGQDLTRQVLTQVILEQQERLDLIPVELLHAVIQTQGTLQQAPFAAFLSAATHQFVTAGHVWAQQMSNLFGTLPGFPGTVPQAGGIGPFPGGLGAQPASGAAPTSTPESAPTSTPDTAPSADRPVSPSAGDTSAEPRQPDEVEALRRRMEALLDRLNKKG